MNIEAKPAIYLIYCLGNQKSYVGQSKSVKKRFSDHRSNLKNQRHVNTHLQQAYDKYGADMFVFKVLEYLEDTSPENLTIRETYWIDFFDSTNREKGFNKKEAGNAGRHNEETKQKISEIKKSKNLKHSDEARAKIKEARARQILIPYTEERREKLRASNTGKKASDEARKKMSEAQKAYQLKKRQDWLSDL
jgi:group I intron endonuclease